ncbi:Nitroreductase family [Acididesulfobacillus acetoxydans]|uniref:Nitroreductase family n=1 Tax=Acididesulfobacillus acetoxydans TaxID=1561005 RepID=A0A8S0XV88_9FIRM|nr:nitroreductase family protein [Acididesulfobacillus acetoxydans]CAA7600097.1 Nitroreductase family [Acididesulfobacillus acetoxydans]CEJ07659.1 Nitroreductase protein [Acididesulfobacillus acetoxydans]
MELIDAMKKRHSVRKYKADSVPDEAITELLMAARLAPSGSNLQPTRFVVIKSPEARARLSAATSLPFVTQAPVVLACCVDADSFGGLGTRMRELKEAGAFNDTPLADLDSKDYAQRRQMDKATAQGYLRLNAAIALEHVALRAADLGLGTCWVMMFDQGKAKEVLGLGNNYSIVALMPVGYADQDPAPRPRLELKDLLLKEL